MEQTMDFRRVKDYFSWLYYQYQIISCCAVLEPWEQSMFNTILLTIFAMVVYTAYVFIPIHIRLAWEFFSKMCGYHSTLSN
ncbi:serine palmitoyltransferase small subunit B [Saccopteryx bilineata]